MAALLGRAAARGSRRGCVRGEALLGAAHPGHSPHHLCSSEACRVLPWSPSRTGRARMPRAATPGCGRCLPPRACLLAWRQEPALAASCTGAPLLGTPCRPGWGRGPCAAWEGARTAESGECTARHIVWGEPGAQACRGSRHVAEQQRLHQVPGPAFGGASAPQGMQGSKDGPRPSQRLAGLPGVAAKLASPVLSVGDSGSVCARNGGSLCARTAAACVQGQRQPVCKESIGDSGRLCVQGMAAACVQGQRQPVCKKSIGDSGRLCVQGMAAERAHEEWRQGVRRGIACASTEGGSL